MAGTVIPMATTTAEVTKTAENTFRDLQIAVVNQLALPFEAMGINIYACPGRGGVAQGRGDRALTGGRRPLPDTKDTYHLERGGAGAQVWGTGLSRGSGVPLHPGPASSCRSTCFT